MVRYEILRSVPTDLSAPSAPVILSNGRLLRDNYYGTLLAQLQFLSLNSKPVRALYVEVKGLDEKGNEICAENHAYTNYFVRRGEYFGANEGVSLRNPDVRSFAVRVLAIAEGNDPAHELDVLFTTGLPKKKKLSSDHRAVFAGAFGAASKFFPDRGEHLWRCTCGAVCRGEETRCVFCGADRDALFSLDVDAAVTVIKYNKAQSIMEKATTEKEMREAEGLFRLVIDYKNAGALAESCRIRALELREVNHRELREQQGRQEALERKREKQKRFDAWLVTAILVAAAVLVVLFAFSSILGAIGVIVVVIILLSALFTILMYGTKRRR